MLHPVLLRFAFYGTRIIEGGKKGEYKKVLPYRTPELGVTSTYQMIPPGSDPLLEVGMTKLIAVFGASESMQHGVTHRA